jgi:serine/threonine-protein kinase
VSPEVAPEVVIDGRYRLIERVGSGGMADVWAADDLQLGRKVALKLLYRRFAQDSEFVERFRREASHAAGLQHPNIVSVYDRGEWEGTYYIAMEFLEGRSLKQVIQAEGALPPARAIDITIQILKAARFAHGRGVIHRDLKPHNAILEPSEDRVKVTDFGIARAGASDMTETGSIMGTAQYLSPEQAQGHAVSAASDLYAIGIVLYELLTGRVPFDGDSAVTIALKQVTEQPLPPSHVNPAVPPALDAVVLRALEKDPASRFVDADEFIAALQIVNEGLETLPAGEATASWAALAMPDAVAPPLAYPPSAYPPPSADEDGDGAGAAARRRPWWRRWWALAIVVALLVGGGVAAYLLTRPTQVVVPPVVGERLTTASAVLQNAGFTVSVTRVQFASPVDQVLRQDPMNGTKADKGSTVSLTVSNGPGLVTVPDVSGLSKGAATKILMQAGLQVSVQDTPSATVPKGKVIGTVPQGTSQAAPGATVTLQVSSGPAPVTVPNVVNDTQDVAETRLSDAGLTASVAQQTSSQPAGTVIAQTPSGGSSVAPNTNVTITVAQAQQVVAIPNVIGEKQGAAVAAVRGAGFNPVVVIENVTVPGDDGKVLHQSTGSRPKGANVTIDVGKLTTTTTTSTTSSPTTSTTTTTSP